MRMTTDLPTRRAAHRYALYLAPTGPWLELGRAWLGRCADTGAALASEAPATWIDAPRRYGLHATLKAPFRLADHARPEDLDAVARRIARHHPPFDLPLTLARLRGFLAWRVAPHAEAAQTAVHALAQRALCEAEPLRAPLDQAELSRRLATPLTPAQQSMLHVWGYPYALDTYAFHITLTSVLADDALKQAQQILSARSQTWQARAMPVHAISIYVQPEPGADFLVARHYGFDGVNTDGAGAAWMRS